MSAMWHAFSVLFRVGASLGLRRGRTPRLVCARLSAYNFVVCSRNLANGAKRASSGRVEAASSRFRARIARLTAACTQPCLFSESATTNGGPVTLELAGHPLDNKPPFVSGMWHAFSVQFRGDAHPGLRLWRNPGLVCGTPSACLADADINGSYMS